MSDFDTHMKKYRIFRKDAENTDNSEPTRIEAYFSAAFHLIESALARQKIHVEKHQKLRQVVEDNKTVFSEKTEEIWRSFQKIENQIRPGQIYGGAINGEKLSQTKEMFANIENICLSILGI